MINKKDKKMNKKRNVLWRKLQRQYQTLFDIKDGEDNPTSRDALVYVTAYINSDPPPPPPRNGDIKNLLKMRLQHAKD